MAPVIPECGPNEDPDAMYSALAETGCLVVRDMSIPLADALALPRAMRSRLGFDADYGGGLGFFDPSVILTPMSPA